MSGETKNVTSGSIIVPERGDSLVEGTSWQELAARGDFWQLVQRKILKVASVGPNSVRLSGAGYVGRARLGDRDLLLVEKSPGALQALLAHATGSVFRITQAHAPASDLGPLASILVEQFTTAVRSYASGGRQWEYIRRREVGSLVGGRIDITASIKLRGRGMRHRIAFDRSVSSYATNTNRIVAAALQDAEKIALATNMSPDDLRGVRAMSLLFADCRDAEVLFGNRSAFVNLAQRLEATAQPRIADLLALGAIILSHESFEVEAHEVGSVPRSWFVSLQTLYETAVRKTLATLLGPSEPVLNGKIGPPRIFHSITDAYTANPDLVVNTDPKWIGDVKYKTWSPAGEASDVYQVLAHAVAHRARIAFIVYVDDTFQVKDLGPTLDGIRVILFAADPRKLLEHLGRAVLELRTLVV